MKLLEGALIITTSMTFSTATSNVKNFFLSVLVLHFGLIVAVVACIRTALRGVTFRTIAIGVLMIYWKAMTAHLYVTP
jgi:hypothetical protein